MAHKILVAEDSADNRALISMILRHHGFDVIEAKNGEDALCRAKSDKPALILMDIQMPKLNGLAAIQQIKADPSTRHIRIIAVTSFAMPGDREKMLEAGAYEYISKPIDTRALPDMVRRLVG
jgi:two-component system, cell cycle response regulator DivK